MTFRMVDKTQSVVSINYNGCAFLQNKGGANIVMVRRLFIILQHSWSRSTDTYVFSRSPCWTLQAFSTLKPSFSRDTSWTGLPTRPDVPLTGGESQEGERDFQKNKEIIWLPWLSKHHFSNVKSRVPGVCIHQALYCYQHYWSWSCQQ